jgi:hypothetical protein
MKPRLLPLLLCCAFLWTAGCGESSGDHALSPRQTAPHPVCPYCTGGYVNFEFQSDGDLSALVSESSWIRVTGILLEGTIVPGSGQAPRPFYYIEAMSVEVLDQVGIDTITD